MPSTDTDKILNMLAGIQITLLAIVIGHAFPVASGRVAFAVAGLGTLIAVYAWYPS